MQMLHLPTARSSLHYAFPHLQINLNLLSHDQKEQPVIYLTVVPLQAKHKIIE